MLRCGSNWINEEAIDVGLEPKKIANSNLVGHTGLNKKIDSNQFHFYCK
jgi:hypothetical protein